MKRHFAVIEIEKKGKWYAYIQPLTKNDNIVSMIKNTNDIKSFTIYDTKRECTDKVLALRKEYIDNNVYMFSDEPF